MRVRVCKGVSRFQACAFLSAWGTFPCSLENMMKKTLLASLVLIGTLGAASAQANDTFVGAVIGGGMGGLIGHSVGGRDGAVVGSLVGAAAGAALASSNEPRYVNAGYGAPAYYAEPAYYTAPPAYYTRPVVARPVYYRERPDWHRHDRHERRDRHHDHRHWR
jgi:hypothetical protein